MDCNVCGAPIAPGKKFCTTCGSRAPEKTSSITTPPPPPPGIDTSLINEILESQDTSPANKQLSAPWKNPAFWTAAAALATIPSLILPWLHLFDGNTLRAFDIPAIFLLTGQNAALPYISAGAITTAAIIATAALSFFLKRNKSASHLRIIAAALITLSLLAPLSAIRSWKVHDSDPLAYHGYLQSQCRSLISANGTQSRFFNSQTNSPKTKAPQNAIQSCLSLEKHEIKPTTESTSGIDFTKNLLGPGFLFSLAGGLMLIIITTAFKSSLKFYTYIIAPTPLAAIVTAATIVASLITLRLFLPARWYQYEAAIYQSVGMRDREEQALLKCMKLPVPSLACKTSLAKTYYDTNRRQQALVLFKHISHSFPNYTVPDKYIGNIYYLRKEYENTIHHLRKYVKHNHSDIDARKKLSNTLFTLGSEYLRKGYTTTAAKHLEEGYALLPENTRDPAFNNKLAAALTATGEHKKASQYLARSADIDPKARAPQIDAAHELTTAGDYKTALKYYKRCIDIEPRDLECYIKAADLCTQYLNDTNTARELLKKALETNDVHEKAPDARKMLEALE